LSTTNKPLFSFGLPTMEIAGGKEPIAIVFLSSRRFAAYKIKPIGQYFILKSSAIRGLFEMDSRYVYFYNKTPVYFYDYRNPKPTDPIIVNELHQFAQKNALHKIKRTDVHLAARLRGKLARGKTKDEAIEAQEKEGDMVQKQLDDEIDLFIDDVREKQEARMKEFESRNKEGEQPSTLTEQEVAYMLTQHLVRTKHIDENQKMLLDEQLKSGQMTFAALIGDLRTKEVLTVHEPISTDCQLFLDEFHAYDPAKLDTFVGELKNIDKGLKTMTSIPVKNWIPATVIMAIFIGVSIAGVVIFQNLGDIQKSIGSLLGQTPAKLLLGLLLR
jgi:hypothetical protein